MSGDHDDPRIARLWREVSSEAPAPLLDARILRAARLQQRRRFLVPLAAGAAIMATLVGTDPTLASSPGYRLFQALVIVLIFLGMLGYLMAAAGVAYLRRVMAAWTETVQG